MSLIKYEWEDGEKPKAVDTVLTILNYMFLAWIAISIANEYLLGEEEIAPDNGIMAVLFILLALWGIMAHGTDAIADKLKSNGTLTFLGQYVSFGKNLKITWMGFFGGLIIGFLLQSSNAFVIAVPSLSIFSAVSGVESKIWNLVWTVIVAPFVEEKAFAGAIPIQLAAAFDALGLSVAAKYLGWIGSSIMFSLFHYVVYYFSVSSYGSATVESLMIGAFLFRLLILFLNDLAKTTSVGYGAHLMNNLVQYLA